MVTQWTILATPLDSLLPRAGVSSMPCDYSLHMSAAKHFSSQSPGGTQSRGLRPVIPYPGLLNRPLITGNDPSLMHGLPLGLPVASPRSLTTSRLP